MQIFRDSSIAFPLALAFATWTISAAVLAADAEQTDAAQADTDNAQPSEVLAIFTQDSGTPAAEHFSTEVLPKIQGAMDALNVHVRVLDASEGAPEDVAITPLMVFQNPRGRSIYQGRAFDVGKLEHFIRTRRAVALESEPYRRGRTAVLTLGRTQIGSPLKVTELAGTQPEGFSPEAFEAAAKKAILNGFERYETLDSIALGAADRLFYMDFYPYRSESGGLSVSAALFSQFDCIDPVFHRFDNPVHGSYDAMGEVFAEAARSLEAEVLRQLEHSDLGDGFDPVATSTPAKDWEALGLKLPEASNSAAALAAVDLELPNRWRIAEATDGAPRLLFHFPPPLDRYSGEVKDLNGELTLAEHADGPLLPGADGWVEASTASVTMGEDSLDNAIREKMIFAEKFPKAKFTLKEMSLDDDGSSRDAAGVLRFGRETRIVANGTFNMMGIPIPLTVFGTVEPVIGPEGEPQLHVRVSYRFRLIDPFGVEGPDGPAPANDTLVFYMDFSMEPA